MTEATMYLARFAECAAKHHKQLAEECCTLDKMMKLIAEYKAACPDEADPYTSLNDALAWKSGVLAKRELSL